MTRNPAILVGVAVVLLAAGFALGFLIGQRRATEDGRSRTSPAVSPSPVRATPGSDPSAPGRSASAAADLDREKLRERILDLEAQLRIDREESGKKVEKEAGPELARQAYEDLLAMETGDFHDPERLRSLIASLSRIDPNLARHFIDRFQKARTAGGSETEKFVAIQLALMSGGPDAADFVEKLLADPGIDASLRSKILSEVSPTGGAFFSIRRLPVSDSLGSTAMTLVRSANPEERRGGAGLLGGLHTAGSRVELTRLLEDPDPAVKQVAIRSLGFVGDQATRKILEPYAAQSADPSLQKAAATAIRELDRQ
jgi:hypothetical protein